MSAKEMGGNKNYKPGDEIEKKNQDSIRHLAEDLRGGQQLQ